MNLIVNGNITFAVAETDRVPINVYTKNTREWYQLHIVGTYSDILAAFTDYTSVRYEWESQVYDVEGNLLETNTETRDISEYTVPGDIVDMRDGTFFVYIGKPTEVELLQETIDNLVLEILLGGE